MKSHRVPPRSTADLSRHDPRETGSFEGGKKEGLAGLRRANGEPVELQRVPHAEHEPRLLFVATVVRDTLRSLRPHYPETAEDLGDIVVE